MQATNQRSCGSCNLCCKVMGIDELRKPMGVWCGHARPGHGCTIYGQHPASCKAFQCMWLVDLGVPDEVRPDRSKIVFDADSDGGRIIARCDPGHPHAWRREPVYSQLKQWAAAGWEEGRQIVAMAGRRLWVITPTTEIDVGEIDPRAPFLVEELHNGEVRVTVMPPLSAAEQFTPSVAAAQLARLNRQKSNSDGATVMNPSPRTARAPRNPNSRGRAGPGAAA